MSKTRNQRKRDREELLFFIATVAWLIFLASVVIYKAVTS